MSFSEPFQLGIPELFIDRTVLARPYRPSRVLTLARIVEGWSPLVVTEREHGLMLVDGFHRLKAADLLERKSVSCRFAKLPEGWTLLRPFY